jgi:AGZA family xanthine/uracil permease-like MFS transporter
MMQKYFGYRNLKTEVRGATATFLCMAYILALNPMILSAGGFDKGSVFLATIIATAIGCGIMAFWARTWPVAVSSGMGLNGFIGFVVCGALGYSPAEALGAVLVAGVLFVIASVTPVRSWIINSIPRSLKLGIGAGIGMFIAVIGFEIMGLTVPSNDPTIIKLGSLNNLFVLFGLAALVTMIVLDKLNVKGSIIISMVFWTIASWIFIPSELQSANFSAFQGVFSLSLPEMKHFMTFDVSKALSAGGLTVVFTLFFVDIFDSMGTLVSVANVAGKVDKKGNVKDIDKALLADSVATVAGAMVGTSTVTSYVESGAGVKEGGRTGMVPLVVGLLFILCIFLSPLFLAIPKQVDGAALIFVALLFVKNIVDIDWKDISETAPAVICMLSMPFLYSISNGIALAFVTYALIKIFTGKFSKVSPAMWVVAILSAINLAIYS